MADELNLDYFDSSSYDLGFDSGGDSDFIDYDSGSDSIFSDYDSSWLYDDFDEEFSAGDSFVDEWGEGGWGTFDPYEEMGLNRDGSGRSTGDPYVDYLRERDDKKQQLELAKLEAEQNKSWWQTLTDDKDLMRGLYGLFGAGLKAYQAQRAEDRADEQADKAYERQKDWARFEAEQAKDMYNFKYGNRPTGGGGGAPAGGGTFTPVTTGTFKKK